MCAWLPTGVNNRCEGKEDKKKRRGGRVGWIDGRDKMFPSYCLSPPSSLFKNEHRTDNKVGGFLVVFFLANFLK